MRWIKLVPAPTSLNLSLTLQAPRTIIRESLPSDPEPALKPGQALVYLVSISRVPLHIHTSTPSLLLRIVINYKNYCVVPYQVLYMNTYLVEYNRWYYINLWIAPTSVGATSGLFLYRVPDGGVYCLCVGVLAGHSIRFLLRSKFLVLRH